MIINPHNRFLHNEAAVASDAAAGTGTTAAATTDASAAADATTATAAASTAATDTAATRPDYLPEKFWKDGKPDHEGLARSYSELETAFSKKHPISADLPPDAAGYQLKPEKLPDGVIWDDAVAARMSGAFHKAGIGATAAKAISDEFLAIEAAQVKAAGEAYEKQLTADRTTLVEKWGGEEKYNERRESVAALVTEKLGEDPNDAALFSNPRIVEFLAKEADYVKALEAKLGEDALASVKGSMAPGPVLTEGKAEANRIMKDTTHPDHEAYIRGDAATVRKVMGLLGAAQQ